MAIEKYLDELCKKNTLRKINFPSIFHYDPKTATLRVISIVEILCQGAEFGHLLLALQHV